MDANGIRVLVDMLPLAHLHTTRATVPLQTNVIEASAGMKRDSEKEWYYGNKDKERLGPFGFDEVCLFPNENLSVYLHGGLTIYSLCVVVNSIAYFVVSYFQIYGTSSIQCGAVSFVCLFHLFSYLFCVFLIITATSL